MAPPVLEGALERLDAADRALLELSVRRQYADNALAQLLRLDPGAVAERRNAVLDRLAADIGAASPEESEEMLVRLWRRPQAAAPAPAAPPSTRTRVLRVAAVAAGLAAFGFLVRRA